MFNKSFSSITGEDVISLITSGATEGNNLEFKRDCWGNGDEDVREMLRDISSIANAYGGYVIVGMDEEEDTGKAKEAINVVDADTQRDRILASCMANLQPRIIGLDIKVVEFESEKKLLIIKIPDSLNLHQITFKGLYQFWKRHDRQKSRMTYDEIRDFIVKNSISSSINEELLKSRKRIAEASGKPTILITAQPIKMESELFKIGNERVRALLKNSTARPMGWHLNFSTSSVRPTLNGLVISDVLKSINLFRNGYTEASIEITRGYVYEDKEVTTGGVTETLKLLSVFGLVEFTYNFFKKVEEIMAEVGYEAPMSYSLSLLNINGFTLPENRDGYYSRSYTTWEDGGKIEIEPLVFEFLNPADIAKELCDRLWQAFGFEKEPFHEGGGFNFG